MEESKKIYLGNLDYSVKEEDIKRLLIENNMPAVEVVVITDSYSGRSSHPGSPACAAGPLLFFDPELWLSAHWKG